MPSTTTLPSTVPTHALAGDGESKSCDLGSGSPRLLRGATIAAPADARCPLQAGRERSRIASKPAGREPMPHHARLALGQRAGLVDHQRVDLLHPLQRLGVLDQHAGLRARPTPTMIDIGVARPSAQGQAMISTETAATSP
jgi:hypothetical protein